MSKKEQAAVEAAPRKITIHPIAVECKVVANLHVDGKFATQVHAMEVFPEMNFNHGTTIEAVVQKGHAALEEKYVMGRGK